MYFEEIQIRNYKYKYKYTYTSWARPVLTSCGSSDVYFKEIQIRRKVQLLLQLRDIKTQAGMVQSPVTSVLNGYNFTEKVQIKEQDIALNWATFQSNVVAGGFI